MPSPEPTKKSAKDRMRGMVQSAVSVLDEKKQPASDDETNTLEDAAIRTTLKRNRSFGNIDIELIRPDPEQVRKVDTTGESFAELVASVREHGVLEPITVRWLEDQKHYQIVTGERRYLASQRAGLKTIAAIVRDVDDTTKAVHQLVENLQRENMNPIDEARAFHRYIAATHTSQDDLAKRIGKSKTYVSRMMSILEKLTRAEQEEIGRVAPAQLPGKSLILEALRLDDSNTRLSILRGQLTRQEAREVVKHVRGAQGRPRGFGRRYPLEKQNATVTITFKKSRATEDEIGQALVEASEEHKRRSRREVP